MNEQTAPTQPPEPSRAGGLEGVKPVHDLLDRQDRNLRWSLLGNLALAAALTASAFSHVWKAIYPPQPEFFATTADGRIIPLIPISEPYVAREVLLAWAKQATLQAYSLDHVHLRKQLSDMRDLFTAQGFRAHEEALKKAGIPETLEKYRAIAVVESPGPALIHNQGIIAGRYAWEVRLQIQVTYEGASSKSAPQTYSVELLIVRVPTTELPRGYAIHQIVSGPAGADGP